jgi:hypothetical protein
MTVPHLFALAATGVAAGGGLPAAILALNPEGYWKLDDAVATNGVADDSSGNGRHGTYSVTSTASRAGGDGGNYPDFDGVDDYVDLGDNDAYSVGTASGLTVFLLARQDAVTGLKTLIAKYGASGAREWFCLASFVSGDISGTVVTSTGAATIKQAITAGGVVPDTDWHAYGLTLSNTSSTDNKVWFDATTGTPTSTTAFSDSNSPSNTSGTMRIGQRGNPFNPFNGSIAHVAVFAGMMSNADMGDLMTAAQADGWF